MFDNNHRVVSQRGSASGRFTFSAADSGEHMICFTPSSTHSSGWLSGGNPVGGIKLRLDLAIGETSSLESTDKDKIHDIVSKVKDLNGRLQDIRREQVWQRVSCPWRQSHGRAHSREMYLLISPHRNERPSFEISPSRPMREWCGGRWCSWLCWASPARGSCLISGLSSSSRSSLESSGISHPVSLFQFNRKVLLHGSPVYISRDANQRSC